MDQSETQSGPIDKPLKQMGMGDLRLAEGRAAKEKEEKEEKEEKAARQMAEEVDRQKEQEDLALKTLLSPEEPIDDETMKVLQRLAEDLNRNFYIDQQIVDGRHGNDRLSTEAVNTREQMGKEEETRNLIDKGVKRRISEVDPNSKEYTELQIVLENLYQPSQAKIGDVFE